VRYFSLLILLAECRTHYILHTSIGKRPILLISENNRSVTCRRKAGILEPAYTEQLSTFPPQRTTVGNAAVQRGNWNRDRRCFLSSPPRTYLRNIRELSSQITSNKRSHRSRRSAISSKSYNWSWVAATTILYLR
jgi:hypothetical protein